MKRRFGRGEFLGWAILLALIGLLFRATLRHLFGRWLNDPTYSHGLLVPAITLFFLYDRHDRLRAAAGAGSLWGAAALVIAVSLFFFGRLGSMLFLQAVSFIAVLAALALLVEGWTFLRLAAFPLAFLIFMCPLPSAVYDPVSARLRLLASAVATVLLQMLGVAAARSGNIIQLAKATLAVEDACSGIRSLFGITATATAFAWMIPGGMLRKSILVVSALPIAVAANILRVTGTGILYHYAGSTYAEGFYHSLEGWVFYVVALAALFAEFFLLKAVFPTEDEGRAQSGEDK